MRKLYCMMIPLIVLTGCVEQRIVDEVNIQQGAAFDQIEDGKFRGGILVQDYLPDKSVENKVFTAEGRLRRDLLLNIQKQSSGNLVTGGVVITIFGDKLADYGIVDFIDTYQRDPAIGARNYLATAHGSGIDILEGDYGPQGVSKYLESLIEHNIENRDVPNTNLHIFLRDYYMKGKDPYLPELRQLNKEGVIISGISLFNGDKEVDILRATDMFFFKLLVDKHSQGSFNIHLKKGKDAAVKSISSRNKMKLSKKDSSQVNIYIDIKGVVKEYTGEKITEKTVKEIAKKLEADVEKRCLKLLKRFQDQGIDPVGFGYFHRKHIRGYDINNWKEDYKNLSFNVEADVKILETGVID